MPISPGRVLHFGTPGVGTGQQYTLVYSQVGVYPVTLSGISGACADTYVDSVVVMPPPEIGLFNDPEVCLNGAISFSSTSTATTPLSYSWDVGGR
jgi:hypothetical protein